MNTFWLKIAALVVVVVIGVVVIGVFSSSEESRPADEPDKTFYDQVAEDKEKFLAEPQAVEEQVPQRKPPVESKTPLKPVHQPAKPTILYFKPLSEIEKVEAERLLNVAVPGRSIGRLPMTGFKLMVDSCRQIIKRWPDSWYAYRAKQMLADMPERFRPRYKITKEEMDVSEFERPRPGTKPFSVEESP